MLSRVAHSVYWMFRYLERAQNTARFIDSDFNHFLDDPRNQNNLWRSLIATTGDSEKFEELYGVYNRENIIRFLTVDPDYDNSIASSLAAARENARSIREIISSEMWEEINTLYLSIKDFQKATTLGVDPKALCKVVLSGSYLVIGLFYSTMNRSDAWHFGRIGMLLERADKTSRILDVKYYVLLPEPSLVGSSYDNTQWAALLKSVSGLEMYRKTYSRITPREVTEFLIYDRLFPRSVGHCVHYSVESLAVLTGNTVGSPRTPAERSLYRLRAELETGTIGEVLDAGLHEYLDGLQNRMNLVDTDLYQGFFAPQIQHQEGSDHGKSYQSQS